MPRVARAQQRSRAESIAHRTNHVRTCFSGVSGSMTVLYQRVSRWLVREHDGQGDGTSSAQAKEGMKQRMNRERETDRSDGPQGRPRERCRCDDDRPLNQFWFCFFRLLPSRTRTHNLARSLALAMAGYSRMTVADLRQELRLRRLPTSGKKAELLARLESSTAPAPALVAQPSPRAASRSRSAASPDTQSRADSHVPPTQQSGSKSKALKSGTKRSATASSIDGAAEPPAKRPMTAPTSPIAAESGSPMASGPAGTLLVCRWRCSRDASVCAVILSCWQDIPLIVWHLVLYCLSISG